MVSPQNIESCLKRIQEFLSLLNEDSVRNYYKSFFPGTLPYYSSYYVAEKLAIFRSDPIYWFQRLHSSQRQAFRFFNCGDMGEDHLLVMNFIGYSASSISGFTTHEITIRQELTSVQNLLDYTTMDTSTSQVCVEYLYRIEDIDLITNLCNIRGGMNVVACLSKLSLVGKRWFVEWYDNLYL
jgi:hypothetical protein